MKFKRIRPLSVKQSKMLILGISLVLASWPTTAAADCNLLVDPSSCADAFEYSGWYGIAGFLWAINRMLLLLAYQIDQVRNWIVTGAFDTAWNAITGLVNPVFIPVASFALLLGLLLFMIVPITGKLNIINIRHVLLWSFLAPLLIVIAGPLLSDLDNARVTVGTQLAEQAGITAPGAIFGARAEDMAVPADLYPSNPCGNGTLERPNGGSGIHLDDLAAAMMYANAQDIHCPDAAGPFGDIPDAFSGDPPRYAYEGDVGTLEVPVDRRNYVAGVRQGTVRLALGLLPSLLAVVAETVNLLFSLSLVILFISIPLNLIFVYFQQTASGITTVFRRSISILQTSWACSFVLGLLSACLAAAATFGSATGYVAFSAGAFVITGYLSLMAFRTITESIMALSASIQSVTGLSITEPISMAAGAAAGAANLGLAAATGGASLAVTGMAAMQQTGNRGYAAAAVAGRAGLGEVGEVAQAMGLLSPESELATGLRAGEVARSGSRVSTTRAMRMQMARDANVEGDDHLTIGERDRLTSAASAEPGQRGRNFAGSVVRRVVPESIRSPIAQTIETMSDTTFSGIDGRWEAMTGQNINSASRVDTAMRQSGLADRRGMVMALGNGPKNKDTLVYQPRLDDEDLPDQANTLPTNKVNTPRLWKAGYSTQINGVEGTSTFWKPMSESQAQAFGQLSPAEQELARAKERLTLANDGILKIDPTQARADVVRAQEAVDNQRSATEQTQSSSEPPSAVASDVPNTDAAPTVDLANIQAKLDRIIAGQDARQDLTRMNTGENQATVIDGEYTISEPIGLAAPNRLELQAPANGSLPPPASQSSASSDNPGATKIELDDIESQIAQSREADRFEDNDIEREIVQTRSNLPAALPASSETTPEPISAVSAAPTTRTQRVLGQRDSLIASLDAEIATLSDQLAATDNQDTTATTAQRERVARLQQVREQATKNRQILQQRGTINTTDTGSEA